MYQRLKKLTYEAELEFPAGCGRGGGGGLLEKSLPWNGVDANIL